MAKSPGGGGGKSVAAGVSVSVGVEVGRIGVAVGKAMIVITAVDPPADVCGERVHDRSSKVAINSATPKPTALKINQGSRKN